MARASDPVVATSDWPAVLPAPLQDFLQYWQALRDAGGGVPPKCAVDPLRMPRHLLPHLGLVDAHTDGTLEAGGRLNLRFRLLGTGHHRATGRDYSGRWFDELYSPEQVEAFEREYRGILLDGKPGYARRASLKLNREFIMFQRILAPLLDATGRPHHVIGYWHWESLDS